MHLDDPTHHLWVGKGDMVEVASAQERIGQVFFSVGSDHDDRPVPGADGFINLDNVEFHLVEHV